MATLRKTARQAFMRGAIAVVAPLCAALFRVDSDTGQGSELGLLRRMVAEEFRQLAEIHQVQRSTTRAS